MLKKEKLIKAITRQIIILKDYIKATNNTGLTDANRIIQSIIADLINEIKGLNLIDLDNIKTNHPAIDLGDINAGICIQVSSNIDSSKINNTISKLLKYNYFKKYPKLKFFHTKEKQKSYTINTYDKDKIQFDPNTDIIDWFDLIKEISQQDSIAKLKKIDKILVDNIELNEESEEIVDESDGIHLLFRDEESFDEWNEDVSFDQGLPKISINVKTGKPNYTFVTNMYTESFKSHISEDKRVSAKAGKDLNKTFLNKDAQKKYHFKLTNFTELEEAGLYKDFNLDIDYFNEIQLSEFIYSQPTNFNVCLDFLHLYPSLSHSLDVILKNQKKERSSYYFDSGESLEKNRISFYSSKDGKLCFRLIDANSKVFLFEIDSESSLKLFEKRLYIEFRFGLPSKKLKFSLFINDEHIYSKEIKTSWKYRLSPQNNKLFANILGNFNGAGVLKKHSIDILKLVTDLPSKKQILVIINEQYIDHDYNEETYVTKDNKLVSMGWVRKQKKIIILP